eukprot:c9026_g1_i1.p1 GENE.c9026_g1_i1~~c9026_g1_i1.p1  ORF type:complete len:890 (+),score=268.03 c9026_g1_i1:30-2672(+)
MALQGLVKAVPNGDTLVIMNAAHKGGPPPEKRVTLSGIVVPRIGYKKDDTFVADEDYAWEAREFLRKLVIGKNVTFQVEHTLEDKDRCFGSVFLEGENIAALMVERGWAKVRPGNEKNAELLGPLELAASTAGVGLHQKDGKPVPRTVVSDQDSGFNAQALVDKFKGKPQQAIVEMVFSASNMRVLVLPNSGSTFHNISLSLSGIRCPAMKTANSDAPEPFALEARFFTETRLLHRDVNVILEVADSNRIYGTITVPQGNIAEALTRNGFAKISTWSIAKCTGAVAIKQAETEAKKARLRLWKDYVPQQTNEFDAKVVEIVSGDTIVVATEDGVESRISLSSLRSPSLKLTDGRANIYAIEAKEHLRSRIIGKKVHVSVEYTREDSTTANPQAPKQVRKFATVKLNGENISLKLVADGLSEVVKHRADDPRSADYDLLMVSQQAAEKAGKGLFGQNKTSVTSKLVNDLTGDPQRAKAFLPTFTRESSKLSGVVEFVANGGRFKVAVPRHMCVVPLALAGLRCPACSRRDGQGEAEPFGDEAYQFSRSLVLQRDVEIEIEACDRGGTFLGHLYINKVLLSVELLKRGYAYLQEGSADRSNHFAEMSQAQTAAQKQRLGIWRDYQEPDPAELQRLQEAEEKKSAGKEIMQVTVTEMTNANSFYVRPTSAPPLESRISACAQRHLEQQSESSMPLFTARVSAVVGAQFTADNVWYRARVLKLSGDQATVVYLDYGNSETLPVSRLCPLDQTLAALPAQAYEARFAYLKVPALTDDFGVEAAEYVDSLIGGRTLTVQIENKDGNVLELLLSDPESEKSANARLLQSGYARLKRKLPRWVSKELIDELREAERYARSKHLGIWEYGDVPDSDDEQLDIGGLRIRK